jgi:hemerythrin
MQWKDDYKIDIPVIDSQHRQLFLVYSDLSSELQKGLKSSIVEQALIKLQLYVTRHFTMEEKYMAEVSYPKLEEQKKAHAYFSQKFGEIMEEFQEKGLTPEIVQTINNELQKWLKQHVLTLDMEFGKFHKNK